MIAAGVLVGAVTAGAAGTEPAVAVPNGCSSGARTERVNLSSDGEQSNGAPFKAALSADGRYVAFGSAADDLVADDTNGVVDVFVRNLETGLTTRVSLSTAGDEGDAASFYPSISADGRYVAFRSFADNLVDGDHNRVEDVFVHDRLIGTTERVSVADTGEEANASAISSSISGDGNVVLFTSAATNLVAGDRNGVADVFVRDRSAGRTLRVSAGRFGEANARSEGSSISASGRVVGFRSFATNLVRGDTNRLADDFVRDWVTGTTVRVNVSSAGAQANGPSFRVMVSKDGRFAGFRSRATNLVPGDTNRALDVFVHDLLTARTTRISVASGGGQADPRGFSRPILRTWFMSRPFLSTSGRYAAYSSRAANLVGGDTNRLPDVFAYDRFSGRTTRVSVATGGGQANGGSYVAGISGDGRVVAFLSSATNLVPGDTNGQSDVFVRTLAPPRRCPRA